MFEFSEAGLMNFFAPYAYEPLYVYGFIVVFMLASSFGLPVPEELTLVTAGLVAHMATNPEAFPPPYPGATGVDIWLLCLVCFLSVFLSDVLVFFIGKFFGAKIIKTKFFQKQVAGNGFSKINSWFQKYGGWACGIFRFTPGLRFPGHLSCGLLGIPIWKFMAIDGLAALISVPTQVYFVATYGDIILSKIREFKVLGMSILGALFLIWVIKKVYSRNVRSNI